MKKESETSRAEYQRKYYEKNKEIMQERARKHYRENKEHHQIGRRRRYLENREAVIARTTAWAKANPEKRYEIHRKSHLKTTYGITQEQFEQMLKCQGNRCAICGSLEPGGRHNTWSVDHCHKSATNRGILCDRCNKMIGLAKDDEGLLASAMSYLRKYWGK